MHPAFVVVAGMPKEDTDVCGEIRKNTRVTDITRHIGVSRRIRGGSVILLPLVRN
jgi:hypothetical protein